jgi:hypothetical protein
MRTRRALLAVGLLVPVAAGVGACSSSFKSRISPMPAGYVEPPPTETEAASKEDPNDLDRRLAVVEGRTITLRRIVREIGGRPEGMSEGQFERQVRTRLKELVEEELFVAEAARLNLQIPASKLDEEVDHRRIEIEESASKTAGHPVTFEQYLSEQGLTIGEFREKLKRALLKYFLMRRVMDGIGPTRPQVEMDVSPAEVRRIYREHPGAFDQHRAVKFSGFTVAIEPILKEGKSFTEADDEAKRRANQLADAYRRGEASESLAARFDLPRLAWSDVTEFKEDVPPAVVGEQGRTWLLAPERRAREAAVFQVPEGELVLGILEVQPARARTWEEVRQTIVTAIRKVREVRVQYGMVIEMLSRPNTVVPQSLADEMIDEKRQLLQGLENEAVLGDIRFQ